MQGGELPHRSRWLAAAFHRRSEAREDLVEVALAKPAEDDLALFCGEARLGDPALGIDAAAGIDAETNELGGAVVSPHPEREVTNFPKRGGARDDGARGQPSGPRGTWRAHRPRSNLPP